MGCIAELRGLGAVNSELQKMGVRLAAISVDPPDKSRGVVESQKLPYPILADTTHSTIAAYGLVHKDGYGSGNDIAIPATIIVDRDGKIVWRDIAPAVNIRPSPEQVLDAARKYILP